MKKIKNTGQFTERFTCFLLSIFLVLMAGAGCDFIISTAETDGGLPKNTESCESNDELCPNNINDPENPNFELPELSIIGGIGSFESPFIINQSDFTLNWSAVNSNGDPISFDYTYSFALAEPGEPISEESFQDLGSGNWININNLNETFNDDTYSFEVRARYSSEEINFTGYFSVDAFQSRGFLFNPTNISKNENGHYTAIIYIDEIEASDDLTAFSLVVNFDNSHFNVFEEDIIIYDENSFLKRDNAEIIGFSEIHSESITIDVGAAGNNLTPLSGGGAVCEISFRPTAGFSGSSTISISSNSELKTSEGASIPILEFDSAQISQ